MLMASTQGMQLRDPKANDTAGWVVPLLRQLDAGAWLHAPVSGRSLALAACDI